MTCNDSCLYVQFNLSYNYLECKSSDCEDIKVLTSAPNISCLLSLSELENFDNTKSYIWYQGLDDIYVPVQTCN
jgi:hypothetical protein